MTCHKAYKKAGKNILRKVPAACQTESELSLLRTYDKKDKQHLLPYPRAWLFVAASTIHLSSQRYLSYAKTRYV